LNSRLLGPVKQQKLRIVLIKSYIKPEAPALPILPALTTGREQMIFLLTKYKACSQVLFTKTHL
jgi:hypothetical protein